MTLEQIQAELDRCVRSGTYIAALRDDGEVGYWQPDKATANQFENRLTVEETRKLRSIPTKTRQIS